MMHAWDGMSPKTFLPTAPAARYRVRLLVASDGLERDRLGRSGQPARLCPHGLRRAGSLGSGRGSRTATMPMQRTGRTAMSADPLANPRGKDGRAPDVFRPGAWVPMRQYREVRTGRFRDRRHRRRRRHAGRRLSEAGFSVVGLDAGPWFRPLEDFASDEAEQIETVLDRRPHLDRRQSAAARQQQQRQGGRRQHRPFRHGVAALPPGMVSLPHPAGIRRRLAARLAGDVVTTTPRSNRR